MKRPLALLLMMLATAASATVVRPTAHELATDVAAADVPSRAPAGRKTQWAPSGDFSALHARVVFEEKTRGSTSLYAGEAAESAVAERDWTYANGNPTRFTDPDGRCVDQWLLGVNVLGVDPQECRNYKNAAYEYFGLKSRPKTPPAAPTGVSCQPGVNCTPVLERLTPEQIGTLPEEFVGALPYSAGGKEPWDYLSSSTATAEQAGAWDARLSTSGASPGIKQRWAAAHQAEADRERIDEIVADTQVGGVFAVVGGGLSVGRSMQGRQAVRPGASLSEMEKAEALFAKHEQALFDVGATQRGDAQNAWTLAMAKPESVSLKVLNPHFEPNIVRGFHGATGDKISYVLKNGLPPREGEVYLSGRLDDTWVHGADTSRGVALSMEVDVVAPPSSVSRVSRFGNPQTVRVNTATNLPVTVRRLHIRIPNGDGTFRVQVIEGSGAVRDYLNRGGH